MKTFNNNLKIYFNYNKTLDNKFRKAFVFDNLYIFTNAYSIVVIPKNADKNNFLRLKELDIPIIDKDNATDKELQFILKLKDHINNFKSLGFSNEFIPIKKKDNCLYASKEYCFSERYINNISKLIGGKALYSSKETDRTLSITGKYGYAFLLAQMII